MPHRTKRQKIASQARRQQAVKIASDESKPIVRDTTATVFNHDFRKSIFIISIITALEIITYFGTMYYHSR